MHNIHLTKNDLLLQPNPNLCLANNIYCIVVCLIVNLPREARQVADYDDYDPQQLLFVEALLSDVDGS